MGRNAGLDSICRSTLSKIDRQIHEVQNEIVRLREAGLVDEAADEYKLRDQNGNFIMIPLLQARANVLLAMAMNQ